MSTQGQLFPSIEKALGVPIAREADPMPSKVAAEAITASGRRKGQLKAVLELVRKYPRSTSLELASYSNGMDRYQVARRLPELEQGGLVRKVSTRNCAVGNRPATTWEAL